MKVRLWVRMLAPTAAISLLLLTVGVVTAWHVHTMQRTISNILLINISSMRAAEELEIAVREVRTLVHSYLLSGESRHLDRIHVLRPEINYWLSDAVHWGTTRHEQALMGRVTRGLAKFFDELDRTSPAKPGASSDQLRRLADGLITREILEPTHQYLDFNEKELEKTSNQNRIQAGRLVFGLLLLGICGSAAGVFCGLGLAQAVKRSLVQLSVPLHAAAGHLEEVVGPFRLVVHGARQGAGPVTWDLPELEGALEHIAERVGAIVERLRQSEREALRAEQLAAVGQMAAGMAHELRNPLTAIKILVQSALDGGRGEGSLGGRDLAVLEEEITRLEGVIHTFLQFARPPQPEKRLSAVQPLIEGCAELVEARAELCGVRIDLDLPAEPVCAVLDPGQFRQVLLNLLLNSLDAVPAGGWVQVSLDCENDEVLCLRVFDSGPGLPEELGERIFAPFVSTKETGLGLGLSITRRIIEAHGGQIEAANAPAGGALFQVYLPLPDVLSRR